CERWLVRYSPMVPKLYSGSQNESVGES
ncbi:MAG: hypothetical protein RLZZ319_590, partial [Actinomycetota bacterium]